MFLRKENQQVKEAQAQVIVKTKNHKQHVVKIIDSSRDTDEIGRLMA